LDFERGLEGVRKSVASNREAILSRPIDKKKLQQDLVKLEALLKRGIEIGLDKNLIETGTTLLYLTQNKPNYLTDVIQTALKKP